MTCGLLSTSHPWLQFASFWSISFWSLPASSTHSITDTPIIAAACFSFTAYCCAVNAEHLENASILRQKVEEKENRSQTSFHQ